MKRIAGLLLCVPMLMGNDGSGCSSTSTPPVQPVNIVSSDFCKIMRATLPPTGKPTWDVGDTKPTIRDARKVGAAFDSRCNTGAGQ